ncbi:hypothetical protein [Oceanihabitans sediminis]|uniref:hypothetical protein n=1 Tax=Oceanihabitans sediminis TaxID=1812012 RepID=UPI00299D06B8|nr:hypothetical protein [Oceanihabitans sediminis]MDX1279336.1 hypothetical protein [Oceanihabitans sediminis]
MTDQKHIDAIVTNAIEKLNDGFPELAKKVARGDYFATVVRNEEGQIYTLVDLNTTMSYDPEDFQRKTYALVNAFNSIDYWYT